jgi:hypothetical protein
MHIIWQKNTHKMARVAKNHLKTGADLEWLKKSRWLAKCLEYRTPLYRSGPVFEQYQ